MVHCVGVHAFYETNVVRRLGDMRQEVAHPRPALPVLLERLDRLQHQFAGRVAGHGAEAFTPKIFLRHRLAVHLGQLLLVVVKIDVRRRAVLEKINDTLGLGREVRQPRQTFRTATGFVRGRQAIPAKQATQRSHADTGGAPSKKLTAVDGQLSITHRRRCVGIQNIPRGRHRSIPCSKFRRGSACSGKAQSTQPARPPQSARPVWSRRGQGTRWLRRGRRQIPLSTGRASASR